MQVPAKLAIAGGVGVVTGLATAFVPGDGPPVGSTVALGAMGAAGIAGNAYVATRATPIGTLGSSMFGVGIGATLATMGVVNLFRHDGR